MIRELGATAMSQVSPLVSSKSLQLDINDSQLSTNLCPTRAFFSNNSGLNPFDFLINDTIVENQRLIQFLTNS